MDESLIFPMAYDEDAYSMAAGYAAMKDAIAKNVDFTAVFAIADAMAIGACRAGDR